MAPRPTPIPTTNGYHHHLSMAPAPLHKIPALGEAGPSSWQQQQQQQLLLARGAALARRSRSHTPVFMELGVIASDGSFNGSCASTTLSGMPLEAPQGSCASYFPDITAYCCSGIGGTLVEVTYQDDAAVSSGSASSTASASSSSSSSSTAPQAICQTTDYTDALACFQLTAETNCKTGQTGLYGVCNTDGNDTSSVAGGSSASTAASSRAASDATVPSSSAASSSTVAGGAQEVTPAAAMEAQSSGSSGSNSNGVGASVGTPGWKASWGVVGILLVSLALQV